MKGRFSPIYSLFSRFSNILLLSVSCLISLVLLEVGLRIFTEFPITELSNRVPDPILGYRYSTSLKDIDESGFRNPPGHAANIAALGDSHTYGVNVASEQTWPAQLGRLLQRNVYNYGVGSYGIFAYYALARQAMDDGAKTIIIGLYPANDFSPIHSNCTMSWEKGGFWWGVSNEIGAKKVKCRKRKVAAHDRVYLKLRSIIRNSAIYSIVDHVVLKSANTLDKDVEAREREKIGDRIVIGNSAALKLKRVERHGRATDLGNAEIQEVFANFKKFAIDLKQRAMTNCVGIGFLLIPSKERVMLEWLSQARGNENMERFMVEIQKQIDIEKLTVEFLNVHGISVVSSLPDALTAFSKAVAHDQAFYPYGDGHPLESGYEAYAAAAARLVQTLSRVRNADADC